MSAECAQAALELDRTSGDIIVGPGIYGRVSPGWLKELRLQGGGTYVFESIELSWRDSIVFEGDGPWDIVVCDNDSADIADPRGGLMKQPAFYASMGPAGLFQDEFGDPVAPQDVMIYSPETSGACLAMGHLVYAGIFLAPDCDILAMFDSEGVGNLWGKEVWTADSVPLSTLSEDECNESELATAGSCDAVDPLVIVESYEATCPAESRAAWSLLTWDASTSGDSRVDFEVRSSETGVFSDDWLQVATARASDGSEVCGPLSSCRVDLTDALWPAGNDDQPGYLELRLSLRPDGTDLPALDSWRVMYSCVVDQ